MDINKLITAIKSAKSLEELDLAYENSLGKKWWLNSQYILLKELSWEEKKQLGTKLTEKKSEIIREYESKLKSLKDEKISKQLEKDIVDITTQSRHNHQWSYSLLTKTRRKIDEICQTMWFHIEYGHDMVSKFENFTSLNIPLTHPATEMHDTFFLKDTDETWENYVLRTHTTAMDNNIIRKNLNKLKQGQAIKVVLPSKVYRYEATDASHDTTFYQLDWIYIDKNISIAHFKDFITKTMSAILEKNVTVRMRPWYFPFVEPGYEIDASCPICEGSWCSLCKKTGWIELMGAGMLHPHVLQQAGVDANIYTWYAFGMGINRLVAVKYRIKDIRLFTNGDLRFSRSFA